MQPHQIEAWVLAVHDRARTGATVEDSRVELKGEWIDPRSAARRIAGQANAARGAPVLWVIGVDEKTGQARGAAREDFAKWWARVQAEFDELAPAVTDLVVVLEDVPVVALVFDTTRVPFVVKNPQGGTVQFEVPWRSATAIRTAHRSELVRILSKQQLLPDVEFLDASFAQGSRSKPQTTFLDLRAAPYVTPRDEARVVIPFHRCRLRVEFADGSSHRFYRISISPTGRMFDTNSGSPVAAATGTEILLDGPCQVDLSADVTVEELAAEVEATVVLDLCPANHDGVVTVSFVLVPYRSKDGGLYWRPREVAPECRRY